MCPGDARLMLVGALFTPFAVTVWGVLRAPFRVRGT